MQVSFLKKISFLQFYSMFNHNALQLPYSVTLETNIKVCKENVVCMRDMAQWLERRALPMSLPAVQFRIPLGTGFSEKFHVSPLSILGHC